MKFPEFATDHEDWITEPEPMLIEGLLPQYGVTLLVGEEEAGKSAIAVSWAAAISTGLPWFGRQVHGAPVLFYSLESYCDLSKRFLATQWRMNDGEGSIIGTGSLPIQVRYSIPNDPDKWHQEINEFGEGVYARLKERRRQQGIETPSLLDYSLEPVVFIDTLRQACGHQDRGQRVEEFMEKASGLLGEDGAMHVIILHHTTKGGKEYAGDPFIKSDTSAMYYVNRPSRNKPEIKLRCDRVKGIPKPGPIDLRIAIVPVEENSTVIVNDGSAAPERDTKLIEIAAKLPASFKPCDLDPFVTGEGENTQKSQKRRLRLNLEAAGLIRKEGDHYVKAA